MPINWASASLGGFWNWKVPAPVASSKNRWTAETSVNKKLKSDLVDLERLATPISLLTGFLGSGKTTVLNHLLGQPDLSSTVVIINEFGEIGLDHELVESTSEEMVLLQSGCLCCTIRGDLVDTIHALMRRRVKGEIRPFERIIIETTGLADPAPILHTLMTEPTIATCFRLDGVITTIDAATAMATFDRQIESVKQAAVADRLLLTKSDLVDKEAIEALKQQLRAINPAAPIIMTTNGAVSPPAILDAGLYNPKTKSLDVQRWLKSEAFERDAHSHDHHDDDESHGGHDHSGHGHHHGHAHDVNRHDATISATCLVADAPLKLVAFELWLDSLLYLKGPDIYRIKGILNIEGAKGPLVIHGVQHIFHPPVMLKKWPSEDRRSRIVFIGRDLDESALRDTLKIFTDGDKIARLDLAKSPLLKPVAVPGDDIAMFQVEL
ncbi:MAG: GTP-binding protein [Rhodospirillaceae bacterium]|nr:GTP-binding protein [Rhodospirillaceae bacterium]